MEHLSEILSQSNQLFPDNIAIEEPGNGQITYKDLYLQTNLLRLQYSEFHVGQNDLVGVLLPKSIESVAAILGILSSNAAYVPVDYYAPVSRNSFIFNDCRVKIILVANELVDALLEAYPVDCLVQNVKDFSFKIIQPQYGAHTDKVIGNTQSKNLAYILYTSGSTGKPKGVMTTHENALSFILWCAHQFNIKHQDVLTSIAPFHFDLSIFDLYVTLLKGAKLVLVNQHNSKNPRWLAQVLTEKKVCVLYTTPTLLQLIINHGKPQRYDYSNLRLLLFAGEVFPIEPLKVLRNLWQKAQFYNLYGPTETNVITWYKIPTRIDDEHKQPFPIGQPCPYATCKLWTNRLVELTPGLQGELLVSGTTVSKGYWNQPQKNNTSFIHQESQRWYKTGDIVKVDEDDQLVFIGRNDRMVKRNGYRIELGEIENALIKHPLIESIAVIASENEQGIVHIKAFIQKPANSEKLSNFQLKQFGIGHLPAYMLPDTFEFLTEFPKTSTHKIDYQRLKVL